MTASICLLLIACGADGADGAEPVDVDPLEKHNVTWMTPSEDYNGSMPIGNGETGLNLWVEPNGDLVFLMSRTDSWDEHLRLCKLGQVRIKFASGLAGAEFKQELKLRQGEPLDSWSNRDESVVMRWSRSPGDTHYRCRVLTFTNGTVSNKNEEFWVD